MNIEHVYLLIGNIRGKEPIIIGIYKNKNKANEIYELYLSDCNWVNLNIIEYDLQ